MILMDAYPNFANAQNINLLDSKLGKENDRKVSRWDKKMKTLILNRDDAEKIIDK